MVVQMSWNIRGYMANSCMYKAAYDGQMEYTHHLSLMLVKQYDIIWTGDGKKVLKFLLLPCIRRLSLQYERQ